MRNRASLEIKDRAVELYKGATIWLERKRARLEYIYS